MATVDWSSWIWYPLVKVYILLWKDPPFFMGKSTISMAIFNSYLKISWGFYPWPQVSVLSAFVWRLRADDIPGLVNHRKTIGKP